MSSWIRETTRAALYVRDTPPGASGPCCTYCGVRVVEGALAGPSATGLRAACLDHVEPGAGNKVDNLVVSCWACNASKGDRSPFEWEWDRIERGLSPVPRWRSRRPEPDLDLAGRAAAAVARPICRVGSRARCRERAREMNQRRRERAALLREVAHA